jgi:hypothetical protein
MCYMLFSLSGSYSFVFVWQILPLSILLDLCNECYVRCVMLGKNVCRCYNIKVIDLLNVEL